MTADHVGWRRALGERVCLAYAEDPSVVATCVVGSVARGWADEFSDVEIFVVWNEPPDIARRRAAVARARGRIDVDWATATVDDWRAALAANGGVIGELWPYEDDEYAEHFPVDGVPVGVSGFTVATIDAICAQLLVEFDPTDDAELVASSLVDGWDVTGSERRGGWRRRLVDYPDGLASAVATRELQIDQGWWLVDALAAREDLVALNAVVGRMRSRIVRVLLALNRRYLIDPRPKWVRRTIESLPLQPAGAALLWSRSSEREARDDVGPVQQLWEETLDLVVERIPGVDVDTARRWFRHRRGPWQPPNANSVE